MKNREYPVAMPDIVLTHLKRVFQSGPITFVRDHEYMGRESVLLMLHTAGHQTLIQVEMSSDSFGKNYKIATRLCASFDLAVEPKWEKGDPPLAQVESAVRCYASTIAHQLAA